MTTHLILSIVLATIGVLTMTAVAWYMWSLFVRRLPRRYRANIEHVVLGITGYDEPSLENIRIISEAFRKASYSPLTNLWSTCVRSFKELGDGRIFVDLDEQFDADRAMETPLRRRNAAHMQTWLLLFGLFWCLLIASVGFMTLESVTKDILTTFGCAILQLATAVLLSFLVRAADQKEYMATRLSFNHLLERIRESLPPYGKDDLIHNLYVLQQNQSLQMRQNMQVLQEGITTCLTEVVTKQIENRFRDAIQKHFTPSIQKMADTHEYVLKELQSEQAHAMERTFNLFVEQVGQKLNTQLDGMVGQVRVASDGMGSITNGLLEVSNMVRSDMETNKQMQVQNREILVEVGGLHQELMRNMLGLTGQLENLSGASSLLAESSREVNEKTLEMAEKSMTVYSEMSTNLQGLYERVDADLGRIASTLGSQMASLDGNLTTSMEILTSGIDTRMAVMNDAASQAMNRLNGGLEENLTAMNQDMTANLSSLELRLSAALIGMDKNLSTSLKNIDAGMLHSLAVLDDSLTGSFGRMKGGLEEALTQLRTNLDGNLSGMNENLAVLQTGLGSRIADLNDMFNEQLSGMNLRVETNLHALDTGARASLGTLSQAISSEIATIAASTHSMEVSVGQAIFSLESSLGKSANAMENSMAASIEAIRSSTTQSVDAMGKGVEHALSSMDATYARGADQMLAVLSDRFTDILSRMTSETEAMQRNAQMAFESAQNVGLRMAEQYRSDTASLLEQVQRLNVSLNEEMKDSSLALLRQLEAQGRATADMFDRNTQAVSAAAAAQIQALKDESSGLLNVLPEQMRTAFETFANTMNDMLTRSMADSQNLLADLERRTASLHEEYDTYFADSERNSERLLSDLRFALESVMDQFTAISKENVQHMTTASQAASDDFNIRVSSLMETIEEQNRTITLYIKDLGLDLGELNRNLKESATVFQSEVNRTVGSTFEAFDVNMAEIVERIGTLTTHIEESVSALPETIRRLSGKN